MVTVKPGIRNRETCKNKKHPEFIPQKHQQFILDYFPSSKYKGLLLYHKLGSGKCHKKNTPILLHNGEIKMVQDIKIGDLLMGDDSTPRKVLSLATGKDDMYDIIPIKYGDDDKYTVNKEHILCLKAIGYPLINDNNKNFNIEWIENNNFNSKTFFYNENNENEKKLEAIEFYNNIKKDNIIEISVQDYLKLSKNKQILLKGYKTGVEFQEQIVEFDPYIFGYWLGNGSKKDHIINSSNSTVLEYLKTTIKKYDYEYQIYGYKNEINSNIFKNILQKYNLINNKYIPQIYKCNSRQIRLQILAGILDSDGNLFNNTFEISQKNEKLIDDIIYLARSLGFSCYKNIKKDVINIYGEGIENIPTKIKQANLNKQINDFSNIEIDVKYVGVDDYYGFTLDGNSRYIMGDFTVTHNTCTSIMVADKMLQNKQIKKVYVLTPGSLRKNWLDEYCTKCGLNSDFLKKYFTFITYNYNIFNAVTSLDFNNSLIIIDEAHNLINGAKNISKNPLSLYNKIINSNSRVLVLTATVIFNNIFEWCLMINLLKDNLCKDAITNDTFNYEKYDESLLSPENLKGIISYFPGNEGDFPDVIYNQPINILMSYNQELEYDYIYELEKKIRGKGPPKKELLYTDPKRYESDYEAFIMASKYIQSRSVSNFYYPLDLRKMPDLPVNEGGWISHEILENRELFNTLSPKFTALFVNILSNFNSKQVVFSFFKEKSGVLTIHNLLKLCGIKTQLYTGDISDVQRTKILNKFNSPNNRYGKNIKVLLLTEAGAEGITLLEVEHVHLLESSITPNKIIQAIGRAVRYKSHINLPKERQFVNIWKYHSIIGRLQYGFKDTTPLLKNFEEYYNYLIINGMKKVPQILAVDSMLNKIGEQKINQFTKFYKILQENSIENNIF